MHEQQVTRSAFDTKSRYYVDPSKEHGKVRIIKKADPKLIEANKGILEANRRRIDQVKKRFGYFPYFNVEV